MALSANPREIHSPNAKLFSISPHTVVDRGWATETVAATTLGDIARHPTGTNIDISSVCRVPVRGNRWVFGKGEIGPALLNDIGLGL